MDSLSGVYVSDICKFRYHSHIVLILDKELQSIVFSSEFRLHYEQIYNRTLFPYGSRSKSAEASNFYARMLDKNRGHQLRIRLLDSRRRDVSCQLNDLPDGDNSAFYNCDVSFASPVGKSGARTQDDCSLLYEVVDALGSVICFVDFPLKMCNSFHTLKLETKAARRSINIEDVREEDLMKKRRRREKNK
jgi:hypothetical protein